MKKQQRKKTDHTICFPDIVTIIRIFIKSHEERQLDCPKYRENQLFFALLFVFVLVDSSKNVYQPKAKSAVPVNSAMF